MIELLPVTHRIQKYILSVLLHQKLARFRDLKPPRTDTNLFSYHLKLLVSRGYVTKTNDGYTLSAAGLRYVDRVTAESVTIRQQPKIITMLVVQNSNGDILIQKRIKQPYIDTWTLPYGKVHIDDSTIEQAAQREAVEKLNLTNQAVKHAGDCYIRVSNNEDIISTTLAHVFSLNSDNIELPEKIKWVRPHELHKLELSPAVEQIVARTFFNDLYFFEEFNIPLV